MTLGLNLGGSPKCKIQFNLAPIKTITSDYFNAIDRAGLMFRGCESGTTPFPIGVGKNGTFKELTRFITSASACP